MCLCSDFTRRTLAVHFFTKEMAAIMAGEVYTNTTSIILGEANKLTGGTMITRSKVVRITSQGAGCCQRVLPLNCFSELHNAIIEWAR